MFQLMKSNHRNRVGLNSRVNHKGRGHYTCLLSAEVLNILLGHSAVGMRQRQTDNFCFGGKRVSAKEQSSSTIQS